MRFRELIVEDYTDALRSEIINLLAAVSAEGVTEVDTDNLLADLQAQGYSVDVSNLMQLMDQLPIVQTASADTIQIATGESDAMVGAEADAVEQDRVDALATKKSTDDIGDDL